MEDINSRWKVDPETLEKINVLQEARVNHKFYNECKPIYFSLLMNEYNWIKKAFPDMEIKPAARLKSFKSTFNKMYKQSKKGETLYDYFGVRYTVLSVDGNTDPDILEDACREIMDFLMCTIPFASEIPGRRKDYIAHPKKTGYQCLHATRLHELARPFYSEVQVNTVHMEDNKLKHNIYKPVLESREKDDIPDIFEYEFDENGFCTGVHSMSTEKAFEYYFHKPYSTSDKAEPAHI